MTDNCKISFYGMSDMGRQRTNNEDAFVAEQLDSNSILAVAIDGVGGYEGGEVAAEIAQLEIPKYLHDFRNGERLELLKQAVISANNSIYDRRQVDTARPNMSCVLTSAIVDLERKVIDMVHVGDTRLYQFNDGVLTKLSHDHSLVGYREEIGDLTEEEAMNHPQRNVISRDVGSEKHEVEDRDFLEATEFPLLPNSILLFCSDGLTDLITSSQITSVLKTESSLEEKVKALIELANEAGGKDNITVVLVEYKVNEEPIVLQQNLQEEHVVMEENKITSSTVNNENKSGSLISARGIKLLIIFNVILGLAIIAQCLYLFVFKEDSEHHTETTDAAKIEVSNDVISEDVSDDASKNYAVKVDSVETKNIDNDIINNEAEEQ